MKTILKNLETKYLTYLHQFKIRLITVLFIMCCSSQLMAQSRFSRSFIDSTYSIPEYAYIVNRFDSLFLKFNVTQVRLKYNSNGKVRIKSGVITAYSNKTIILSDSTRIPEDSVFSISFTPYDFNGYTKLGACLMVGWTPIIYILASDITLTTGILFAISMPVLIPTTIVFIKRAFRGGSRVTYQFHSEKEEIHNSYKSHAKQKSTF